MWLSYIMFNFKTVGARCKTFCLELQKPCSACGCHAAAIFGQGLVIKERIDDIYNQPKHLADLVN